MELTVYGPLRGATGTKTVTLDATPGTVAEVIDAFLEAYPRARSQVLTEDGALRPSVRVMVDGVAVDPDARCPPDATVALFPAMQGG